MQFLLVLAEQRAICTTRAPCLASQALSFESAYSLLPLVEQRARVHPLFATSPGEGTFDQSDKSTFDNVDKIGLTLDMCFKCIVAPNTIFVYMIITLLSVLFFSNCRHVGRRIAGFRHGFTEC